MRGEVRTVERELARIARGQHGVATRAELLAVGVSVAEIDRRVASGSLIPEHRGVYRVGHCAPSLEARYLAAAKACGQGAVLSGPAAGHLYCLLKGSPPPPELTTPTERRVPGVRTRRSRKQNARETTSYRGIPITTVPRTLVDL